MFTYILFFILISFFLYLGRRKFFGDRDYYWVVFFLLFLFCSFRFDVGYDYTMYFNLIEGNIKFLDAQLNRLEFFSRMLIDLSHNLGFTQLFFIVSSLIIIGGFYKTIKKHSEDISLSTLIFICFPIFFFQSLSIVRQFMAIAIIFYGFRFIKERKLLKYNLFVLLAFMFHKSAFLAIPLYFLYGSFNRKVVLFLYVFSFFSSNLLAYLVGLLSDRYAIYINGVITGEGGTLILIFFQIIGLLLLPIIYANNDKEDKEFNFYIISYYVGLFIWASLAKFGHAGLRGGMYFMSYTILLIPYLKYRIKQYYIIKYLVVSICVVFFFFNLYISSKHEIKDQFVPYQFYFNKTTNDLKPNE